VEPREVSAGIGHPLQQFDLAFATHAILPNVNR
jgi:hypothetical protein